MENDVPPPFNAPPPAFTPPPPRIVPATPTPTRKSRGWMIAAIVLLVLLGVSVLFNFGQLFEKILQLETGGGMRARYAGPRLEEFVVEDNDAATKIAVVSVQGIISGQLSDRGGFSMVDVIKAQLHRATDDRKVKAVILKVDSPGGEVLASDEISQAIESFQEESKKPVIVSMGSLAASGGYYVAAPCRWIVANELTITGSIGVIMHGLNYRGLLDKVGLVPEVYKSGKYKDMLSGSREPDKITPEERAMIQNLIDQTYGKFKSVVEEGREYAHDLNKIEGRALAGDWQEYADGRVLSGKEAYELGFVDELGNFDDAVDRAKHIANIRGSANIIEYRQHYDLGDFLGMFGDSGGSSRVLKVDLGVELPKLQAGHLYYLWSGYLY